MSSVTGIHHITCIAGDPQENVDFYTRVLGMRLVKKSVNQDVPDTYHLFYADGEAHPGADLTFFPWPKLPPVQKGEAERLVAEFLARHRVTSCPTRYAVAIEQRPQSSRGGY